MNITIEILKKALALQEEIEAKQAELKSLLNGETVKTTKRTLSPEAIEKIRQGQRNRWNKTPVSPTSVPTPAEATA